MESYSKQMMEIWNKLRKDENIDPVALGYDDNKNRTYLYRNSHTKQDVMVTVAKGNIVVKIEFI